jgi:hypothetical protein
MNAKWLVQTFANLFAQQPPLRKLLLGILLGFCTTGLALSPATPVSAHAQHEQLPVTAAALSGLTLDEALCGPGNYRIEETDLCTHGADAPLPPAWIAETVAAAKQSSHSIRCDGDGVSGKRIQLLYVRAADVADRYADYVESMRLWAADADAIFDASAHQTGGHRHLRFVTNEDCQIEVGRVVVSTSGDDSFQATVRELRTQGYTDVNRKYLMFVDSNLLCGIASAPNDDKPDAANRSNLVAAYARVDRGCWDGVSIAHELTHTLGGVQHSAPNASGGWHCVDENDLMCYSDSPLYPAVEYACKESYYGLLLDCNHDDYFHINPLPGSYLATHWNVANSEFLINSHDEHAALPTLTLQLDWPLAQALSATPARLTVTGAERAAESSSINPVERIELYENETLLTTLTGDSFEYYWQAPTPGVYTLTAQAYDQQGYSIMLDPMIVTVEAPQAPAPITPIENGSLVLLPMVLN